MSAWSVHAEANLLPLSRASTLEPALREWSFTGNVVDHGEANEDCRLCDHEHLRYHFEIANKLTRNALMVGSKCIETFDIAVPHRGGIVRGAAAAKPLRDALKAKQRQSWVDTLRKLARSTAGTMQEIALSSAAAYETKGKLSPRQAAAVLRELQRFGHSEPSPLGISQRRADHRQQVVNLSASGLALIWPHLTKSQQLAAIEDGVAPPVPS